MYGTLAWAHITDVVTLTKQNKREQYSYKSKVHSPKPRHSQ